MRAADLARPGRHPCDIHRIARQCGVRLYDGGRTYHSNRAGGSCFSPATLRRIGRAHGSAHLALVLRLVVETTGNEKELYSETLLAISALLQHQPDLIERGAALFDAFDTIDLADLRQSARTMRCGLPAAHVMRILLHQALHPSHDPRRIQPAPSFSDVRRG